MSGQSPESLRAQLLRLAGRIAAAAEGQTPATVTVRITSPAGSELTFTSAPGELSAAAAGADPPLKPSERRILSVCTHEPQTAKKLAGKLGRRYSAYLRRQLTALCRRRHPVVLLSGPDGYRLPD